MQIRCDVLALKHIYLWRQTYASEKANFLCLHYLVFNLIALQYLDLLMEPNRLPVR